MANAVLHEVLKVSFFVTDLKSICNNCNNKKSIFFIFYNIIVILTICDNTTCNKMVVIFQLTDTHF